MAGAAKPKPYHHGALKEAMLEAAERILERDGIQGLTLRAAAREAGASHAAPKNHFGDLTGLLSELAAVGFIRFREALLAGVDPNDPPGRRSAAVGRGYVEFALANPGLFQLMFRGERLDNNRPALQSALQAAFGVLSGAARVEPGVERSGHLSLGEAARLVEAWSGVHGFSMLLIDGRLRPILAALPPGTDAMDILDAMLSLPPRAGT